MKREWLSGEGIDPEEVIAVSAKAAEKEKEKEKEKGKAR